MGFQLVRWAGGANWRTDPVANVSPHFGVVKTEWFGDCGESPTILSIDRPTCLHSNAMILILSDDAVAAALLGALIETLGYAVKFARAPEQPEESIRRVRPRVCLLDCDDPAQCSAELLGRAAMRGISVVIFGTSHALSRVRELATAHEIDTLLVPPDPDALDQTLKRALQRAG